MSVRDVCMHNMCHLEPLWLNSWICLFFKLVAVIWFLGNICYINNFQLIKGVSMSWTVAWWIPKDCGWYAPLSSSKAVKPRAECCSCVSTQSCLWVQKESSETGWWHFCGGGKMVCTPLFLWSWNAWPLLWPSFTPWPTSVCPTFLHVLSPPLPLSVSLSLTHTRKADL